MNLIHIPIMKNLTNLSEDVIGEMKIDHRMAAEMAKYLANGIELHLEATIEQKEGGYRLIAISIKP